MLNIKEIQSFLGKAAVIDDGVTEITVTLDVGPRIIGLRPINGFNIMYNDVTDSVNKDCSSFYGDGAKWHIYGGHRLWLSPEDITTYYPDNNPIKMTADECSVTFTPDAWKKVDVQPQLKITFDKNNGLTVEHKITNLGKTRKLCLWALTVMKSGGVMSIPLSTEDTGFLANRNVVMWHYASFKDERLNWADDKIILKSDVSVPHPFKIGAYCDTVNASYVLTENGVTQKFTKTVIGEKGAEYPDFCCNFESYCTHLIHEIETLSPVKIVPNSGELIHTEHWTIE